MRHYSRRKMLRRRQEVKRYIIIGSGLLVLAVASVAGYKAQSMEDKRVSAEEAVASVKGAGDEAAKSKSSAVEGKTQETEEQKVERVKRASQILQYPHNVIELLDKNSETIKFVENYGAMKDNPPSETIGASLEPGKIPHLLQWDERWGYAPYGENIVAVSGCGPTCMAMVVAGLTQDASVTPDKVAAYGTENGYLDEENNTLWTFMEKAAANWNIQTRELPLVEGQVAQELAEGRPIICSVTEGDFTQEGHFIVLTAYDNGTVTVNDPFSKKNSERTWVFSEIQNQIRAMWVYSL